MKDLIAYQDRATSIWIVRDRKTHKELAHEPTKHQAVKALQALQEIDN